MIEALGIVASATERTVTMNVFAILVVIAALVGVVWWAFPATRPAIVGGVVTAIGFVIAMLTDLGTFLGGLG